MTRTIAFRIPAAVLVIPLIFFGIASGQNTMRITGTAVGAGYNIYRDGQSDQFDNANHALAFGTSTETEDGIFRHVSTTAIGQTTNHVGQYDIPQASANSLTMTQTIADGSQVTIGDVGSEGSSDGYAEVTVNGPNAGTQFGYLYLSTLSLEIEDETTVNPTGSAFASVGPNSISASYIGDDEWLLSYDYMRADGVFVSGDDVVTGGTTALLPVRLPGIGCDSGVAAAADSGMTISVDDWAPATGIGSAMGVASAWTVCSGVPVSPFAGLTAPSTPGTIGTPTGIPNLALDPTRQVGIEDAELLQVLVGELLPSENGLDKGSIFEGANPRFDLNLDSVVDFSVDGDLGVILDEVGTVIGDLNFDRRVDSTDLGLLLNNYNQSDTLWSQGNLNGDNIVNSSDLGLLLNNFGYKNETAQLLVNLQVTNAVPEPNSTVLLMVGFIALVSSSRKKR